MAGLTVVTPPTADPVTLAEAKDHLRVTSSDEDGLIVGYLMAARQHVEDYTGRALLNRTYDLKIDDGFPCEIELLNPPLVSVTSVTYVDLNGATQTLSSSLYQVVTGHVTGEIVPAYMAIWPPVRYQDDAVTVRYVAGYGTLPGSIPEPIRMAILMLVGHFYANREAVNVGSTVTEMPMAVTALLSPYRVYI